MQSKIFYAACFGIVLGTLLASFVSLNEFFLSVLGLMALGLLSYFIFISKSRWGIIFLVSILGFICGSLRYYAVPQSAPDIFEANTGIQYSFTGIVVDEPSIGSNSGHLDVRIQAGNARTEVLMTVPLGSEYKYGDEISFTGKLEKPENFIGDQGKEFDYINYLEKDGIFYVMAYPKIEIISSGHGSVVKRALFAAKDAFVDRINYAIPSPESLYMGGLILGEKSSFDQALRQSFVNTGTIHIVALSGYNITIVAEWFMKLFSFLPQHIGIGAGIFSIVLFIIMAGGSSTAIRAGIMAVLALIARATGRTYDIGRALILAGVTMILVNPLLLAYDVSFQLSFLATIAVVYVTPKIEKYFLWVTTRFGLREVVSVTTAAYLFVLPFIIYEMGNLSIVALPANFLVLPFVPFTMMLGFLTGFTGLIWNILALPFGFMSYLFLHYELAVIGFLSRIPFAAFSIPNFPLFVTILIYAIFIWFIFGLSIKKFFTFHSRADNVTI